MLKSRHSPTRLGLLLVGLVLIGTPPRLLRAAPRPGLQPTPPPGVAAPESSEVQHRTLNEDERKKARFHMDFDKVDIAEVIKYIAQWTGRNFILGDNIRGKITIIGPTDVTADEAYNAFVAALKTNSLQITPTGKFLKIEAMKDSVATPIPTCVEGKCAFPLNEQMVTRLIRTKYNEADSLKSILQQFKSKDGQLDVFPPDVIIISDTALEEARIESILRALDQPGTTDNVHVVPLLHALAQEMSTTLTQIFQAPAASGNNSRHPLASPAGREGAPGAPPAAGATGTAEAVGLVTVTKIIPDERSNRLIILCSEKAFEKVKDLINKLDVAVDTGQVHVYYLENADAEELASTLSQIASGTSTSTRGRNGAPGATATPPPATPATPPPSAAGASAGSGALFTGQVKVTADKGTNSLLIAASPNDYRNMLKIIDKLDIRRRQVFIEAVVMEVKLNDSDTLNVDLHSGYAVQGVNVPGSTSGIAPILVGSETSGAASSLSIANLASLTGFLAGIQGPPITVNGLNITLPAFGVILNALQSNSDVNVISTPHLLTSDNNEAEISVGETVPFQAAVPLGGGLGSLASLASLGSSSTSSTTSALGLGGLGGLGLGLGGYAPIQRVPVELRLKIKPHINESDYVKLEIDEQVENIASVSNTLGPTTAKRAVKTTVFAKDQTSVVIGGLIQEQTTHSETRTPILGEIPVIGALFRADTITRDKTNLLLFLTPYIIRDQSDFRAIFERKLRERQEFVARYFGAEDQYQAKVEYERKHGPLAVLLKGIREEFARVENGGPGTVDERIFWGHPLNESTNGTPGTAPGATPAPLTPPTTPGVIPEAPPGGSMPVEVPSTVSPYGAFPDTGAAAPVEPAPGATSAPATAPSPSAAPTEQPGAAPALAPVEQPSPAPAASEPAPAPAPAPATPPP
jgi:general secretion pathway protein D